MMTFNCCLMIGLTLFLIISCTEFSNTGKSYYVMKNYVDQSLKTILGLAIACHNLHVASISHKILCVMTAYTFIAATTIMLHVTTNS